MEKVEKTLMSEFYLFKACNMGDGLSIMSLVALLA